MIQAHSVTCTFRHRLGQTEMQLVWGTFPTWNTTWYYVANQHQAFLSEKHLLCWSIIKIMSVNFYLLNFMETQVAYVFAWSRSQPSLELSAMYQRTDIGLSLLMLMRKQSKSISRVCNQITWRSHCKNTFSQNESRKLQGVKINSYW